MSISETTHDVWPSIVYATRSTVEHGSRKSRSSNPAAAAGHRFERKFATELAKLGYDVERNPWFVYDTDAALAQLCSPDVILVPPLALSVTLGTLIVIEVKRTYVTEAIAKLRGLYIPVIRAANESPTKLYDVRPLVVVQNLTPGSPKAAFSIREALKLDPPVMQWLGTGPVIL